MNKLYIASLGLGISIISSCLLISSADSRSVAPMGADQQAGGSKKPASSPHEWTKVHLPIEQAEILVSDNERIFAVGVDGIAEIGLDHNAKKINLPTNSSSLLTKDGGLSLIAPDAKVKKAGNQKLSAEGLCHPASAIFIDDRLYSVGPCEHTGQMWSFGLSKSKDKSFTLDFTYSTYPHSDTGDPVYGPDSVVKIADIAIFPSQLDIGPAIMGMSDKASTLKIIWHGDKSDGSILSTDFIGSNGIMLMSKGRLMRSEDGGETWNSFSEVPKEYEGKIWQIKLRSTNEVYVIGQDGLILHSFDAGKTWSKQESNAKGPLYKITLDEKRVIVLEEFKTLLMSDDRQSWKELEFDRNKRIDDVLICREQIYVLSESTLYVLNTNQVRSN
jgi:Photosynthesis system II assembly factor YCF48